MTDEWDKRLKQGQNDADAEYIPHLVTNRLTVLAEEGKEAITFISESDTTYPMIRWLDRAKKFLFGIVAHENKNQSDGTKKQDNHFSMYVGKKDGSRDGVFDLEFYEAEPMLSLQRLGVRLVDGAFLTVLGDNGKRYQLKVSENGALYAERINMRADSEVLD